MVHTTYNMSRYVAPFLASPFSLRQRPGNTNSTTGNPAGNRQPSFILPSSSSEIPGHMNTPTSALSPGSSLGASHRQSVGSEGGQYSILQRNQKIGIERDGRVCSLESTSITEPPCVPCLGCTKHASSWNYWREVERTNPTSNWFSCRTDQWWRLPLEAIGKFLVGLGQERAVAMRRNVILCTWTLLVLLSCSTDAV